MKHCCNNTTVNNGVMHTMKLFARCKHASRDPRIVDLKHVAVSSIAVTSHRTC